MYLNLTRNLDKNINMYVQCVYNELRYQLWFMSVIDSIIIFLTNKYILEQINKITLTT